MEMHILLDPYILAVPVSGKRSLDDYLERLYVWTTAIGKREAQFWLPYVVYETLQKANLYPSFEVLRNVIGSSDNSSFDVQTTMRACERSLYGPPIFEDLFENQSWYYEKDQVHLIPAAITNRLPPEVADALRETLALAVLGRRERAHPVFEDLLYATVPNGFQEKSLYTYVVTYKVTEEEANEETEIKEEWRMIFSPEEIDDIIGLLSFWKNTTRALAWARHQVTKEGFSTENMANYRVGKRFNQSILATHMNQHPQVMEALFIKIVKCLCGIIPRSNISRDSPNHPIREGRNSHTQVTRKRGNAKDTAWRLRIQGDWRLHYWLLPDGTIELANVEYGHAMHIEF